MLDAAKPLRRLSRSRLLQGAAAGLAFGIFSFSQATSAKTPGLWSGVSGDRDQFELSSAELRPWADVLERHWNEDKAAACRGAAW